MRVLQLTVSLYCYDGGGVVVYYFKEPYKSTKCYSRHVYITFSLKNSPRKKCAEYLNVLKISVRPVIILGIPEEKIFLINAPDVEVQILNCDMKIL